jgi:glycosyltransferase involved in cell wall biosynthesis
MIDYSNLTICVAAYNEASGIADTLTELKNKFPEAEVIVINDASQDSTGEIVEGVEGVSVIHHSWNMGYGASLKTAMRAASRDVVAWYDGDGQHDPGDLERVAKPVLQGEKDAVIGIRAKGSDVSIERLPGKMILKWAAQFIVRGRVPDLNSGLRAFRLDVIKRYLHLLPDGFSASSISTILMMKRGYRLGYVDIVTRHRKGQSTVQILRDGMKALQLLLRMLILFEAFIFFTAVSILLFVPGFVYGLYIAMTVKLGLPVLAATLMLSGVLTFLLGVICDQITELRKERFEDFRKLDSVKNEPLDIDKKGSVSKISSKHEST